MTADLKTTFNDIARSMRELHKLLLEYQRRIYEKSFGRVEGPYQLLNLAMEDPQFAWLRALSAEMVHLDEVRLAREGIHPSQQRLIATRIRSLMITDHKQTAFQLHLEEAKAEDPAILMAASALLRLLPPAHDNQIFVSAEEQKDPKDTTPGAIRPGKLVPGFGDKGYYQLGAILESPLGTPIPTVRLENEIVVGVASEDTVWVVNGDRQDVPAWAPVIVKAGSGAAVETSSSHDGMLIRLFIRPRELGGEVTTSIGELVDENGWLRIGKETLEESGIQVYARALTHDESVDVPVGTDQDTALFVIAGEVEVDGVPVLDSQLLLARDPAKLNLVAKSDAMVLVTVLDPAVKVTRAGTIAR